MLNSTRAGRSVAILRLLEIELKRFCLLCKHFLQRSINAYKLGSGPLFEQNTISFGIKTLPVKKSIRAKD